MDIGTGTETGRVTVAGATDMVDGGTGDAIVATPVNVTDAAAEAAELAKVLGGDAATYAADLAVTDADTVVVHGVLTSGVRTALQAAIDGGLLPGIQIDKAPLLAVAGSDGVSFVSDRGTVASIASLARPATGLTLVSGVDDGTQLWATTTDDTTGDPEVSVIAVSGDQAKTGPGQISTIQLPGAGSRIVYDAATVMVEVLGTTPDGSGATVYVIEPHGKAVFADHRLPFTPVAMVLDHNETTPPTARARSWPSGRTARPPPSTSATTRSRGGCRA